MAYSHNPGVLNLALTLTLLMGASAAPPRQRRDAEAATTPLPRWHIPCRGSQQSADVPAPTARPTVTAPPTDRAQLFDSIYVLAALARNASEKLKLRFLRERIQSATFEDDFRDMTIKGLPQVPIRLRSNFTPQVNQSVQESHQNVAKCIVFLEQTDRDEATEEEEFGRGFKNDTDHLLNNYYNLLCSLEVTLEALGITPLDRPNTDIIMEEYRVPESSAVRHSRDYIILRDCRAVMNDTALNFGALKMQARQPTVRQ